MVDQHYSHIAETQATLTLEERVFQTICAISPLWANSARHNQKLSKPIVDRVTFEVQTYYDTHGIALDDEAFNDYVRRILKEIIAEYGDTQPTRRVGGSAMLGFALDGLPSHGGGGVGRQPSDARRGDR